MVIYSIYIVYFLALLYYTKRRNLQFVVEADDIRYVIFGLILYCCANLFSKVLIFLDLKNGPYEIVNEHFLIVAIGVFLLYKLNKENDLPNKD